MRVVFMGTPEASAVCLRAVAAAHDVAAVYTQPTRPAGRGLRARPSPVKQAALDIGLDVLEPSGFKDPGETERVRSMRPAAIVVVAYGHILPGDVLEAAGLGSVNVHFSLLPRWRGAAPVERAIMAGDSVTGVTTMLMDEGLDTGPILLRDEEPILPDDTQGSLLGRLTVRGSGLLLRTLEGLESGALTPAPQPDDGVTYAKRVRAEEAQLDFGSPAAELARTIRAFNPAPGAYTWFGDRRLKVWRASAGPGSGEPARIAGVSDALEVQTVEGRLTLEEVQPEGRRRMSGASFTRGYGPALGARLGRPAPP